VYYYYYYYYLTANGVLPGGSGTTVQHNTQITHHAQTKHSKGHTTCNEYNANVANALLQVLFSVLFTIASCVIYWPS
jgi:hypothetical protein